jgi:hypothetical protein
MKLGKTLLLIAGAGLIGLGLYAWSVWPATTVMPPSWIRWRLDAALPRVPADDPWKERGRYLVTVAGCAMCHTPYSWIGPHGDKAFRGGMRVRWKNDLGERVALNLTPDPETGIGRWTERDFLVAMKSGLTPDGRAAHWQAMPWDMHSNWSLDDLRAMYRYLMSLPPEKRGPSTPVEGPLPEADTFYFGE